MLIGVPKEIKDHEYRVGLTPDSVNEVVLQRPRGRRGERSGGGNRSVGRGLFAGRRDGRTPCGDRLRSGGDDRQGEGAAARGARDAACGPGPLHLSPPRPRSRTDRGPRRERGGVHRVRDGHLTGRRAAPPRTDVGSGGPALDPGRRPCPRTDQRRQGNPARRGAGRAAGQGRHHRRWGGRHPCGAHRDGDGRRHVGDRPLGGSAQGSVAPVRADPSTPCTPPAPRSTATSPMPTW